MSGDGLGRAPQRVGFHLDVRRHCSAIQVPSADASPAGVACGRMTLAPSPGPGANRLSSVPPPRAAPGPAPGEPPACSRAGRRPAAAARCVSSATLPFRNSAQREHAVARDVSGLGQAAVLPDRICCEPVPTTRWSASRTRSCAKVSSTLGPTGITISADRSSLVRRRKKPDVAAASCRAVQVPACSDRR